jgi:nitrite reductase/ring-hydroxylating ferredoxin subunit
VGNRTREAESDAGRSEYQRVAGISEVEQGGMLCVELDGRELLICRLEEGFFAIDNLCSHADARMSEGRLRGHRIMCPLHGASFDVRDGSVIRRPASRPIRSYPVRVEGEDILVDLSD